MKIKLLSDQHSLANNDNNHDRDSEDNDNLATDHDEIMERHLSHGGLGGVNNQRRRSSIRGKSTDGAISSLDVLHDF